MCPLCISDLALIAVAGIFGTGSAITAALSTYFSRKAVSQESRRSAACRARRAARKKAFARWRRLLPRLGLLNRPILKSIL
jgi:hypothetical protein